MTALSLSAVITTIQPPTVAMQALACCLGDVGARLLVIGDRKSPATYPLGGAEFYSISQQQGLDFRLARALPENHYARKNLGYLLAIQRGTSCIYETDDDNRPLPDWAPRSREVAALAAAPAPWLNAYAHFTVQKIWPRGLPLDEIGAGALAVGESLQRRTAPIQQGLANGSPDVDAVWRLVLDEVIEFEQRPSLWLPPGSWCPFNSQSTWWWPSAYPLLYLPSHCSFRMTDIWRSFIAQRCLWELGYGLVFHAPEVFQDRNEHCLLRDFEDEIPGYLQNRRIAELLESLPLAGGIDQVGNNLMLCYEALVSGGILPPQELNLVAMWLQDLHLP